MERSRCIDFEPEFIVADLLQANLAKVFRGRTFDVVSCQFAIHYFFGTREAFERVLGGVASLLKSGGYFLCTTIDGDKLRKMLLDGLP